MIISLKPFETVLLRGPTDRKAVTNTKATPNYLLFFRNSLTFCRACDMWWPLSAVTLQDASGRFAMMTLAYTSHSRPLRFPRAAALTVL